MDILLENINTLVNENLRNVLGDIYDISPFETEYISLIPRETKEVKETKKTKCYSIRISPKNSPRGELYQGEDFVSPPGTPTPRDKSDSSSDLIKYEDPYNIETNQLCLYVKEFKDKFYCEVEKFIKESIKDYTPSSLTINNHLDRITIKFNVKNN